MITTLSLLSPTFFHVRIIKQKPQVSHVMIQKDKEKHELSSVQEKNQIQLGPWRETLLAKN